MIVEKEHIHQCKADFRELFIDNKNLAKPWVEDKIEEDGASGEWEKAIVQKENIGNPITITSSIREECPRSMEKLSDSVPL